MAFLTYLDASGSGTDPKTKAISVGGFVAHETAWAIFEGEWQKVLDDFGVPELHMRDYAHSQGAFAAWKHDKVRRDAFMSAIADLIRNSQLQPLGATIPISIYRLFNRHYCVEEAIGAPYGVAVWMTIAMSAEWRDKQGHPSEPVRIFLEHGDNQQAEFRNRARRIAWEPEYVAEPMFLRKKSSSPDGTPTYVVPFQACDFIAYEQAKALTDLIDRRKTVARRSFRNAVVPLEDLPTGHRSYWSVMERQTFTNFVKNFGIPRRFNHFRGRSSAAIRSTLEPLAYLDRDYPIVGWVQDDGFIEDPGRSGRGQEANRTAGDLRER